MKKLQQTSLEQTGAAILALPNQEEKIIPLFTNNPVEEVQELVANYYPSGVTITGCYFTNNLMETKIEDIIANYRRTHKALPEDYMDELLSGFPYTVGLTTPISKAYYL